MQVRVRSSGTPMVPTVAVTIGKGKAAVRLLMGPNGMRVATTREQTAAAKPPKGAPGLAGRWRWSSTSWAAGQLTLTGVRKAGPLSFEVQGVVTETRNGYTQRSWVWTVNRKTDRKGTPPASRKGRAKSYGDAVRAAYTAGIDLEGEVCGLRTVARNTRAGRTFESAARTTGQAFKAKEQASSIEIEQSRTPTVRKRGSKALPPGGTAKKTGQKKTAASKSAKDAAEGQTRLF